MYKLIQYSDNYSKTSGTVWKYGRDKTALAHNSVIADFTEANTIANLFRIKGNR